MSQHDLSIANQGFPAFRSDLNDALQALGSMQSGTTAPSTTYANMLWYDTTNNIVKMRNEDNDAWISLFTLDQTNDSMKFETNQIIEVTDNSNAALRITQLGTGLALRVEDESNPDSTPTVIDASGNVGIGTSSPTGKLNVSGSGQLFNLNGGGTSGIYSTIGNTGGSFVLGIQNSVGNGPVLGATGAYDALLGTQNATNQIFITNNTERMRIDSSGNLLVGTTIPGTMAGGYGQHSFYSAGGSGGGSGTLVSRCAGSASEAALVLMKSSSLTTTSNIIAYFYSNNTTSQGQINANGANAAAFGTFSDQRLKENITDLPPQLESIMALRPVEYDYIESEGGGHQIGFVAQEVQSVYPDLVGEREDGMLTLTDLNKNDARLIKAIQEQQAIINAQQAALTQLQADVAALKGQA